METFFDFFWLMLWLFLWIIWIMLLFRVFTDVFRSDQSGWAKAGWTVFVLLLPYLGVLVYLISQGKDMARRSVETAQAVEQSQRDYIRDVAGSGGGIAAELESLASLRDRGVITEEEFAAQKAKLLG
jgi:hypothetical protein